MNRNKIVHLYGNMVNITDSTGKVIGQKEADDITNHWFIGHPIDAVWDIKVLGVYQQNEAALAARYGQKPGDFKLLDVDNDGKYTNADRMFLGQTSPRYRWSFRNEFIVLKNFDLSFLSILIGTTWVHLIKQKTERVFLIAQMVMFCLTGHRNILKINLQEYIQAMEEQVIVCIERKISFDLLMLHWHIPFPNLFIIKFMRKT